MLYGLSLANILFMFKEKNKHKKENDNEPKTLENA